MDTLPEPLPNSPLPLFQTWLDDARMDGTLPNPDAMSLATVSPDNQPAARIVLCKQFVTKPGYLVFYTNYESSKSVAIESQSRVAGVFHWDHMNRQVRIEGLAMRSPEAESDEYFASRDRESQIGAWVSAQSYPLNERADLLAALETTRERFPEDGTPIPRPSFWGGYRIWITAMELWVRGDARLHDRGRWERRVTRGSSGNPVFSEWHARRLQP